MQLNVTKRCSSAALCLVETEWDDLWRRSDTANPLNRAGSVDHWCRHFSTGPLRAIEVRTNGALVAALPMIAVRGAGALKIGALPSNAWATCGTLLLDASVDQALILDELVEAINDLSWPLVQLFPVATDQSCWHSFREACHRRCLTVIDQIVDSVGVVEIGDDWQAYRMRWSSNHRRHIDKAARRATRSGRLHLDVHTEFASGEIERLLKIGFEIEDRSWKGDAGTSVLRTPGMLAFFQEQAVQLARWQQLQLTFLKHNDRPIAFEYGYRAKGTYFSHKVGYDPAYSDISPGQLLRAMLLERFHRENGVLLLDFCGPLTAATANWSTRTYAVAKWLIAPRRFLSRCVLRGQRALASMGRFVRS